MRASDLLCQRDEFGLPSIVAFRSAKDRGFHRAIGGEQ
jgi:hypothetical protein